MNILQLCIRFPPAPGGAENHVYHICRELKDRGHEIMVFTSDLYTEVPFKRLDETSSEYQGLPVRRFRAYSLRGEMHYVFVPKMAKAVIAEPTDIIHTHSYGYYQSTIGALTKRIHDRPMVITPHFHPQWSMWGGNRRKSLRKVYDRTLAKTTMAAFDLVICHTENEKELLKQYNVLDEKVRIIPAGVDFSRFEKLPSPEIFKRRFRITGNMVLYVGRLASNKGLMNLIESVPKVLSQFPKTTFVLVGEDEGLRDTLVKRAAELGISDSVLFTGHITENDLFMSAFTACDVFVLPSEYEAFGLVLLEAGACKKPCVATKVGGVPEVIEDGITGLLVEYDDVGSLANAITLLLGDEAKRKQMGRAARERVKNNFTWTKVVDQLERVYEEVIEKY